MLCSPSSYGDWTSPHPLQQEEAAPAALIPFPAHVDWKTGTCPKKAPVSVKKNAALAKTLGKEGYELQVRPNGILIKAATDAGVFYARRTLDQLGARGGLSVLRHQGQPGVRHPLLHARRRPQFPVH